MKSFLFPRQAQDPFCKLYIWNFYFTGSPRLTNRLRSYEQVTFLKSVCECAGSYLGIRYLFIHSVSLMVQ